MTSVSIVIPVFNRCGLTRRCLDTLRREWPTSAREVIVVDDGSTDSTAAMLANLRDEDPRFHVVSHVANSGFAAACNAGAGLARGESLVFLNNDTVPCPGWLDRLVEYTALHPEAAVVGARLLFPDGTVQHAGVTIGQDHNPHHLYVGFPAEHPAVNRSGRVPIVTAACMLVRKTAFDEAKGFDTSYRNGHEDVDLCLRLADLNYQVHYCHQSVVVHYESATRGRQTVESAANGRRYRDEWAAKVESSDLARYIEDGLVRVAYDDTSVRLHVDPLLGTADHGHEVACNRLLRTRTQQVADLLRMNVALLSNAVPSLDNPGSHRTIDALPESADVDLDEAVIEALSVLRDTLARRDTTTSGSDRPSAYRRLVGRVRAAIVATTPPGSAVAVVSRGDEDLIDLDERTGIHFPSDPSGTWLGYHPAGSGEASSYLDDAIRRGVTHLVFPSTSIWWLDQYCSFAARLRTEYRQLASAHSCIVFELVAAPGRPT